MPEPTRQPEQNVTRVRRDVERRGSYSALTIASANENVLSLQLLSDGGYLACGTRNHEDLTFEPIAWRFDRTGTIEIYQLAELHGRASAQAELASEKGEIFGFCNIPSQGSIRGLVWRSTNAVPQEIKPLPDHTAIFYRDVSPRGLAVGWSEDSRNELEASRQRRAIFTYAGTTVELARSSDNFSSEALAVNREHTIVGSMISETDGYLPCIWTKHQITMLRAPQHQYGFRAVAVTDGGVVLGQGWNGDACRFYAWDLTDTGRNPADVEPVLMPHLQAFPYDFGRISPIGGSDNIGMVLRGYSRYTGEDFPYIVSGNSFEDFVTARPVSLYQIFPNTCGPIEDATVRGVAADGTFLFTNTTPNKPKTSGTTVAVWINE